MQSQGLWGQALVLGDELCGDDIEDLKHVDLAIAKVLAERGYGGAVCKNFDFRVPVEKAGRAEGKARAELERDAKV